MKKDTAPARDFLVTAARQMQSDSIKEFLAAAAAADDGAFEQACQKGRAADSVLRNLQGHALNKHVARAVGLSEPQLGKPERSEGSPS